MEKIRSQALENLKRHKDHVEQIETAIKFRQSFKPIQEAAAKLHEMGCDFGNYQESCKWGMETSWGHREHLNYLKKVEMIKECLK